MKKLLLVFAIFPALLFSQTRKQRKALEAQRKADEQVISNLRSHTQFFLDKKSQQAATTSPDNDPALQYIINEFKTIGVQPKGTNGYLQQFKMDDGKRIEPGTSLKINGTLLTVRKDYFPLPFSASKSITGMPAMALREKGAPWFIDIKEWSDDSTKHDSDLNRIFVKEANRAATKGATALLLYNSSTGADNIHFNKKDKTPSASIPVIYITSSGYNKYFTDQSQVLDIEANVVLKETTKNLTNIIGYLDNAAASNILIATPYDKTNNNDNEALPAAAASQDVVSGRSMLIELARMLSKSKAKNNNYTFVGYSNDDSLSKDSKWLNSSSITSNTNYIINLDKVGRYDEDKQLTVSAYGTSPDLVESIKPLAGQTLELSFDSTSISGASNSALPLKVPILNFSTSSVANDNSSPKGDINYQGELNIARFIYRFIESTDTKGKLAFKGNTVSTTAGDHLSISLSRVENSR